jgi:TolA-binding protein
MKRGLLALSFGTLLLGLNGCTPVSELEEENQRLLSRIDTLEVLRESCDSRLSSLSQRITSLEQERISLADANRQLSEKLSAGPSLPTAVVDPSARPATKTATSVAASAKGTKGRKGAVKLPPANPPQTATKESTPVLPPSNVPGNVVLGESSVTQAVVPTPAPAVVEKAPQEKPLPKVEPTRRRPEPFQTSRPQGTPSGPMGWPESSPERTPARQQQETSVAKETRVPAPESSRKEEAIPRVTAPETPPSRPPAANTRDSFLSKYQSALSDFNNRNYTRALETFQTLQQSSEQNEMIDNCAYWVGECRYALGDYRRAADAFGAVLAMSGSDKADAALLMRGQCYAQLGRKADAKRDYRTLVDRYPNSSHVKQARHLLKTLR